MSVSDQAGARAGTGAHRRVEGALHRCAQGRLGPEGGAVLGKGDLRAQGRGRWVAALRLRALLIQSCRVVPAP